ncbi:MAG TPA: 5'-nucleotidase [Candidatus Dormibacteraeota bacterium]|jgi:5'-nucleotidase|nr:5'-nucleotidase [Candidatus Dormibacteraeota bacterium]
MPYDLSTRFVVGISSSALFDLEEEAKIFDEFGLQAFIDHQRKFEDKFLEPGSAFLLIRGLLELNTDPHDPKLEVILMSQNHPDVCLRVFHSIKHHGLAISRASLTGGAPLQPYLKAFKVKLFLSTSPEDVQDAANHGVAASLIYSPPPNLRMYSGQVRVAFDGDCVLFSDQAQKIFDKERLPAFHEHESEHANEALPAGPFAPFLRFLADNQGTDPKKSLFRVALITDRNAPAHERAIKTLRSWNVRIDEAHFLGGVAKSDFLTAFEADIFFDDKPEYCKSASLLVPTGQVFQPESEPSQITLRLETSTRNPNESFLVSCQKFLRGDFQKSKAEFSEWYRVKISDWPESARDAFLRELDESAVGTPKGKQRRSTSPGNSPTDKLSAFLERLRLKHEPRS